MDYLLILITAAAFFWSLQKQGLLPFPTVLLLILLASQTAFLLTHDGYMSNSLYSIVDFGGLSQNYLYVQSLYCLMAVFFALMMLGTSRVITLWHIQKEMRTLADKQGQKNGLMLFFVVAISLHLMLFFCVMDMHTLWFHAVYLQQMESEEAASLLGNSVGETVSKLTLFMYVAALLGLFFSVNLRMKLVQWFFYITSSFYFLFLFGEHSRFSVALPVFLTMNVYLSNTRYRRLKLCFLVAFSFFTYGSALMGRSLNEHGLSSIYDSAAHVLGGNIFDATATITLNLSEGIFAIAESLQITAPFSSEYKMLSFSPLPSFIDGFSSIRESSEHRLHEFVPMPGVAEALNFGLTYCVLLCIFYSVAIRVHLRLAKQNVALFLLCNFLIMFSLYHAMAYPLRNALRFAWLSLFISLFALKSKAGAETNQ